MATIVGTPFDDQISQNGVSFGVTGGMPGNGGDTIQGGAGNDNISGGAGDDLIQGEGDNDALSGGEGNDTLQGGAGNDGLNGGAGNDSLAGGDGDDQLDGTTGRDTLDGGAGNDVLSANGGDPLADGGAGDDLLFTDGDVTATVFQNIETLRFSTFFTALTVDQLNAFPRILLLRNDSMVLTLVGGGTIGGNFQFATGDVSIRVTGSGAADNVQFGSSIGRAGVNDVNGRVMVIDGAGGDDTIVGGLGDDDLRGGTGNDSITGGTGNDTMNGEDGTDTLFGGVGDDQLAGGAGDDILIGGAGADAFFGNAGFDVVAYVDASSGVLLDLATPGLSTGDAAGDSFVNQVEGFAGSNFGDTLRGAAASEYLNGLAGDDTISGGGGNDTLIGGTGDDSLAGGTGNDVYQVDSVGDVITENAGEGIDTVFVLVDGWTVAAGVENVYLAGGVTILGGGAGDDQLVANLTIGSLLSGGQGNDILWGQNGDDTLDGGIGQDVLRGSAGADVLIGGAGQDQLVGGTGADRFTFNAPGWGEDQIFDFAQGEGDRIDMRGSGITGLGDFAATYVGGGNTQLVAPDGSIIDVYGVTGLTAADFIFA